MFDKITVVDAFEEIANLATQLDLSAVKNEKAEEIRFNINGVKRNEGSDYIISFDYTMIEGRLLPFRVNIPTKWGLNRNGKLWVCHDTFLSGTPFAPHWKWRWVRQRDRLCKLITEIREQNANFQKQIEKAALRVERFLP